MIEAIATTGETKVYLDEFRYRAGIRISVLQAYIDQLNRQLDDLQYIDDGEVRYIAWEDFLEEEQELFERFWRAARDIQ